jgi:murein DD-endopeptidase MepM/ murein hydrolase activator NlpD
MHPTDGDVTQYFLTYPQASGEPWGHTGRDYGGKRNAIVRTIADGTVLFAGWGQDVPDDLADRLMLVRRSPNSGKVVIIQHDGWLSLSAHLNDIAVVTGQSVKRGQTIGGLGSTGRSTGDHLHYETILEPCLNSPLFGRYDPQLQIDLENITAAVISAAASAPITQQEAPMSATEVKQILDAIKLEGEKTRQYAGQVLVSGYTVGGKSIPGLAAVDIENQKRIGRLQRTADEIKAAVTPKEAA